MEKGRFLTNQKLGLKLANDLAITTNRTVVDKSHKEIAFLGI